MSTTTAKTGKASVLMVDDEAVSRKLLEYYLGKNGFTPVVAGSAAAARSIVAEMGPDSIDCVVTDYNMPGETGLELLFWLKQSDPTLSVIMVTATTERETVAATLRGGASDFLDKPITESGLLAAVESGIATTGQRRRLAEAEKAVRDVGQTQYQMFGIGPENEVGMEVCFHPIHSAGGDFVNCFQLGTNHFQVLAADVAGHDLHSAYVSAYFQGMARGMMESGQPLTKVLRKFNNLLLMETSGKPTLEAAHSLHSLCACIVDVDLEKGSVALCNFGIPSVQFVSRHGHLSRSVIKVGSPLGWFEEIDFSLIESGHADHGSVLVWTDGLEDFANTLGVSPCSVASRLLRAQRGEQELPDMSKALDDVLALRIPIAQEDRASSWLPIIHEIYRPNEIGEIDAVQSRWQRSLELALPEVSESRIFDLMLAARETVINALKHGCGTDPGAHCLVTVAINTSRHMIRVVVSDTGPGHDFDWAAHQQDPMLADLHRGLALIYRLATKVTAQRHGAELTLDFSF